MSFCADYDPRSFVYPYLPDELTLLARACQFVELRRKSASVCTARPKAEHPPKAAEAPAPPTVTPQTDEEPERQAPNDEAPALSKKEICSYPEHAYVQAEPGQEFNSPSALDTAPAQEVKVQPGVIRIDQSAASRT